MSKYKEIIKCLEEGNEKFKFENLKGVTGDYSKALKLNPENK